MKTLKVIDLFAGVGGFRLGLEKAKSDEVRFKTIWANQWEPGASKQHAADIYRKRFNTNEVEFSGQDIEEVLEHSFEEIPDHDLLVGGFPCQDYSVARTLSQARGLIGEKGVLWWSIYSILKRKGSMAPSYLMLENVDRLLKSPASQRGRDFAVMLASLAKLGYTVEWRVINAADYGMPQRRRRVFILGYKQGTKMDKVIRKSADKERILQKDGVIAQGFRTAGAKDGLKEFEIEGTIPQISKIFSSEGPKSSPFRNSGIMYDGKVWTQEVIPRYGGRRKTLGGVLVNEKDVPEEFYINGQLEEWRRLKGAKKEVRMTKTGHVYNYSEGGMVFPDALDKPSRTMVTGEGGPSPSRFKHVIKTNSGRYRRLVPIEMERLNMFPDDHTKHEGVTDNKRAFLMGNALVVGVVTKLGKSLAKNI